MAFDNSPSGDDDLESVRYPRQLMRRVAEHTGFSYRLSALDLSNDGGELAGELARLAKSVTVMVDDAASFQATERSLHQQNARVQLRIGNARELAAEGAHYWLVTIGRPLHRMDGAALLDAISPLVDAGGAVAVLGFRYPKLPINAWRSTLALDAHEPTLDLDEGLLLGSAFTRVERVSVFTKVAVTVDHAFEKLSASCPGLTPNDLRSYTESDGQIHALLEGHALIARREGERSGRWS